MACTDLPLADLETADVVHVRAMLASLTLDGCYAVLAAELRASLVAIVEGAAPDPSALERGRDASGAELGEYDWYNGGIEEMWMRMQRNTLALVGPQDELVRVSRQAIGEAIASAANGQFGRTRTRLATTATPRSSGSARGASRCRGSNANGRHYSSRSVTSRTTRWLRVEPHRPL